MREQLQVQMVPIGVVRGPRTDVQDDFWGGVVSTIEINADRFTSDATTGLEEFSHLEVVFLMDRVAPEQALTGTSRPRKNPDWPVVGIFAQRSKWRPNRIGVSRCRLLKCEGLTLTVEGLDAIDGTPVLDIKPWLEEMGPRGEVRQPDWSRELMREYYQAGDAPPEADG